MSNFKLTKFIRNKIGEDTFIFKFLRFFYHSWVPTTFSLGKALDNYNDFKTEVQFVQIGSNDGKNGDPLHKYIIDGTWRGVLVEPVEYLFNRLRETYKDVKNNLIFINVAIAEANGQFTFYSLRDSSDPKLPYWYNQLGSFNKEIILKNKHAIPEIESLIVEKEVSALTFDSLLNKTNQKQVDLIHIDTEGYDFEILKIIDLERISPDLVIYEHKHLALTDYKKSVYYLIKNGYKPFICEGDTFAVKKSLVNAIINS